MTRDPAVEAWREAIDRASGDVDAVLNLLGPPPGESTSARLRRVEAELGSALSALTVARQERDEARAKAAHWLAKTRELARDLAAANVIADTRCIEAGQCGWRPLAVKVMREQQETTAELARLRAEVSRVRGQEAGLP